MPGRTDNEIKNYWNSWIKKKIRKSSSSAPNLSTPTIDHHHPQLINYSSINQLDNYFTNQENVTTKETLFSSTCPLFMFDTSSLHETTATDTNVIRPEVLFHHDSVSLSSDTWNLNHHDHHQHHQVQTLPPHPAAIAFTTIHDTSNYNLPPLIENNVENSMVPIDQVQSCNMDEEGGELLTLESLQLQRQEELNEWVETQQQCPSFIFSWESVEGQIGGEEQVLVPNSSHMGTPNSLSPFPSSLL